MTEKTNIQDQILKLLKRNLNKLITLIFLSLFCILVAFPNLKYYNFLIYFWIMLGGVLAYKLLRYVIKYFFSKLLIKHSSKESSKNKFYIKDEPVKNELNQRNKIEIKVNYREILINFFMCIFIPPYAVMRRTEKIRYFYLNFFMLPLIYSRYTMLLFLHIIIKNLNSTIGLIYIRDTLEA